MASPSSDVPGQPQDPAPQEQLQAVDLAGSVQPQAPAPQEQLQAVNLARSGQLQAPPQRIRRNALPPRRGPRAFQYPSVPPPIQAQPRQATETFVAGLPVVPIQDVPQDDRECRICFSPYGSDTGGFKPINVEPEDVVRLACGHIFGRICLLRWLALSPTCPVCRNHCFPGNPPNQDSRGSRSQTIDLTYQTELQRLDRNVVHANHIPGSSPHWPARRTRSVITRAGSRETDVEPEATINSPSRPRAIVQQGPVLEEGIPVLTVRGLQRTTAESARQGDLASVANNGAERRTNEPSAPEQLAATSTSRPRRRNAIGPGVPGYPERHTVIRRRNAINPGLPGYLERNIGLLRRNAISPDVPGYLEQSTMAQAPQNTFGSYESTRIGRPSGGTPVHPPTASSSSSLTAHPNGPSILRAMQEMQERLEERRKPREQVAAASQPSGEASGEQQQPEIEAQGTAKRRAGVDQGSPDPTSARKAGEEEEPANAKGIADMSTSRTATAPKTQSQEGDAPQATGPRASPHIAAVVSTRERRAEPVTMTTTIGVGRPRRAVRATYTSRSSLRTTRLPTQRSRRGVRANLRSEGPVTRSMRRRLCSGL